MKTAKGRARADYGQGDHEITADQLGALGLSPKEEHPQGPSIQAIGLLVQNTLKSPDYRPPLLPEVAVSLTELTRRANVSIGEIEATVTRDPAVAAKLMAVANSAFFSRGKAITSLKMAIMRLGLAEVRNVAFQVVAQNQLFRVPDYTDKMRELFDAALFAASISREICRVLRFESDLAFLCGLLHDMGRPLILSMVGQHCRDRKEKIPPPESLKEPCDVFHARAGALVCKSWGLSEVVVDSILNHHQPEKSTNPSQMATVVAITDLLCRHAGIGVAQQDVDPMAEPIFYRMNMSPEQVADLLKFAKDLASGEGEENAK